MPPGLTPELERRVDDLAPHPPQGLKPADAERWALCSRTAAVVALAEFPDETETEQRKFAWGLARTFFRDPETFPMGTPQAA
jgi:hypothetical protein